jgi:hypothetical protein
VNRVLAEAGIFAGLIEPVSHSLESVFLEITGTEERS